MKVIVENAGIYGEGIELVSVLEEDKKNYPISDVQTRGCWIDIFMEERFSRKFLFQKYFEQGEVSFELDIPDGEIIKFLANYFSGCHFEIYLPEIGYRFLVC